MLQILFIALLVVHGLIHLMGATKAFHWASIDAIHQPITRAAGVAWLVATVLFLASGALLALGERAWWLFAVPALLLSQAVIIGAWRDARFGTIANVVIAVPVALALFDLRSTSLRMEYLRASDAALAASVAREATHASTERPDIVAADELRDLPAPVQRWLARAGVIGQPRVRNVRAQWSGRIKGAPDRAWMPMVAEQVNTWDPTHARAPTRLFFMEMSMFGVPVVGLHAYQGAHATMDVRVAGVVPIVDARGPEMDRSETVTMLNDMCALAPASLLDDRVTWRSIDAQHASVTFTNAGHTVSAELTFDGAGDLVSFMSEDRQQTSDGTTYNSYPWVTPFADHRDFDGVRVPAAGSAKWLMADGVLVYAELVLDSLEVNAAPRGAE